MIVLDTSFLVSLYLPDDDNHHQALETFEKHRLEEMLISDMVLFETLTVLNYEAGTVFAKEVYEKLISNSHLQMIFLNETERREILAEFFRQRKNLSMEDISVIHACKKTLSLPLTFDKGILKALKKNEQD